MTRLEWLQRTLKLWFKNLLTFIFYHWSVNVFLSITLKPPFYYGQFLLSSMIWYWFVCLLCFQRIIIVFFVTVSWRCNTLIVTYIELSRVEMFFSSTYDTFPSLSGWLPPWRRWIGSSPPRGPAWGACCCPARRPAAAPTALFSRQADQALHQIRNNWSGGV